MVVPDSSMASVHVSDASIGLVLDTPTYGVNLLLWLETVLFQGYIPLLVCEHLILV